MLIKIKSFLKLVRWFHELLAVLPFLALFIVINYFTNKAGVNCSLSGFDFTILCICVQLLIAAGCVLNDIMDRNIDKINKPKTHIIGNTISLNAAKIIFLTLTFILIILSVYICCYMFIEWAYICVCVYLLSILYDVYFKRLPLLGNLLMALLTAFIPLVLFFFAKECISTLHNPKINVLIYLYAIFPFLIIVPRELSLDISDIEGDKADGCKTLPIIIGAKKSKLLVTILLLIIIILSIPIAFKFQYLALSLVIIDVSLLFYIYKLKDTVTRIEYIKIGRFLWFTMIIGLIGFTIATIS